VTIIEFEFFVAVNGPQSNCAGTKDAIADPRWSRDQHPNITMTEIAGEQTNASMDFADAGIIPSKDVMLNTANELS